MSTTRVRDWSSVDYYAVLGVPETATDAEIAQAYRTLAKQLHPDTNRDVVESARFNDVAAAYTVLSDRQRRRDYDSVRGNARVPAPVAPITSPAKPSRWTRRRAWYAFVGGVLCTVLGLAAAFVTWQLHTTDADRRAAFVPVTAQRAADGQIVFITRDERTIHTAEPRQHGEGTGQAPTMKVRYDPNNPEHVIVDRGTLGRDITFAIVALKLLVGGLVFAVLGARRLKAGFVTPRSATGVQ